ncbi:MAG TPA: AAA family ATPase [Gaiellaceae bacterium]|jgi:hypothetical protein
MDAPPNWGGFQQSPNGKLESFDGFAPIQPKFVERPLLQAGTFHLLAGRPSVGKGALCARWLARCTNGSLYGEPRRGFWLSSEEDPSMDLRPRLDVAGADPHEVIQIPNSFQLPRDIPWLKDAIGRIGNVGLVVLDPLANHIGGTNSNADEEVRAILQPLAELAGTLNIPIVGVRHVSTKEARGAFLARVLGSTAWIGVPRVVLGAAKDAEGDVHVRAIKGNRVRDEDAGVRFELQGMPYLDWDETVVAAVESGESLVDIDGLLAYEKEKTPPGLKRKTLATLVRVLREHGGEMESDALHTEVALRVGLKASTVKDYRFELVKWGWVVAFPERDSVIKKWKVRLANSAPYNHDLEAAIENALARARAREDTPTTSLAEIYSDVSLSDSREVEEVSTRAREDEAVLDMLTLDFAPNPIDRQEDE